MNRVLRPLRSYRFPCLSVPWWLGEVSATREGGVNGYWNVRKTEAITRRGS